MMARTVRRMEIDDAHRSQSAEETGRGIAALIVFGEDGGEELHHTHDPAREPTVLKMVNRGRCLGSLVRTVWPERVQLVWKV